MRRGVLISVLAVVVGLGSSLGLGFGLGLNSSGEQTPTKLAVFPFPDTPDASATSQISFLGVAPGDIKSLTVEGSKSATHQGNLSTLAGDRGAGFVADDPFSEGETVTVTAELRSKKAAQTLGSGGDKTIAFTFTVAVTPPPTTSTTATTAGTATQAVGQSSGQTTTPTTQAPPAETQSFHSAPDLKPPAITVSTPDADPASGYVFLDSQFAPQNGPMILDSSGNVVWFRPLENNEWAMDVRVQSYEGKPVLTWWQGLVSQAGHGDGAGMIVDTSYQPVATVKAAEGYGADLHEFQLTSHGTAFMTIYHTVQADLTSVGGAKDGHVTDGIVQEVDIKTGQVLWEWHALGHVPLTASYAGKPDPQAAYDYFHVNSIEETPDGNILVSARNTWAIYLIDRKTGEIKWQLGGKGGSIRIGQGVQFEWQHDARLLPDGTFTIFDNASSPPQEEQSRGLHISVDVAGQVSTLLSSYTHAPPLLAGSQGSVQVLPNGNLFVGWGDKGSFTEFTPDGKVLFDVMFPPPSQSYRAYRSPWQGTPTQPPAMVAMATAGGGVTAYASWNGATGIASWQLLAGESPDNLSPVTSARATGFETSLTTKTAAAYLAVRALDSQGNTLGTSPAQPR